MVPLPLGDQRWPPLLFLFSHQGGGRGVDHGRNIISGRHAGIRHDIFPDRPVDVMFRPIRHTRATDPVSSRTSRRLSPILSPACGFLRSHRQGRVCRLEVAKRVALRSRDVDPQSEGGREDPGKRYAGVGLVVWITTLL